MYSVPTMLDETEPPTKRQIIAHYHYIRNCMPELSKSKIDYKIANDIRNIWIKVDPALPIKDLEQTRKKVGKDTSLLPKLSRKHGGAEEMV